MSRLTLMRGLTPGPRRPHSPLTPGMCTQVSANLSLVDAARLHAVASAASADSRIASWDTKWTYLAWRPGTAIPLGNA